jgi:DNA-directed RNA polymerase specialized sigma subunit
MSKNKKKKPRNELEVKSTSECSPKIEKLRQRNSDIYETARTRKIEEIKKIFANTNGEFTEKEKKLFDVYLFEDKEPEEVMVILGLSPDEFWRFVYSSVNKMKKHIRNFTF